MLRHRGVHPLCLNFLHREEEHRAYPVRFFNLFKTTNEIPLLNPK